MPAKSESAYQPTAEQQRARYSQRRALGLCTRCARPVALGRSLCAVHLQYAAAQGAKRKEKVRLYKRSIRAIENARKRTQTYRDRRNALRRQRKVTDPAYAMADRLRKRIGRAIRDRAGSGAKKALKTAQYIGCSVPELMAHIQSLFLPGMAWNNRHLWHIDHKRPCAAFDLTDPEQQKQCFHYTNLQPLWEEHNLQKHTRLDWKP